eukprot:jgi/Chlat1/1791/Chrsp134S02098
MERRRLYLWASVVALWFAVSAASALVGSDASAEQRHDSLVMEVAAEDFDDGAGPLSDGHADYIAVVVYTSWCRKARKFLPAYEAAAQLMHTDASWTLTKVDAELSENLELTQRLGVVGYPHLFVYRKGRAEAIDSRSHLKLEKMMAGNSFDAQQVVSLLRDMSKPLRSRDEL